MAKSPNPVTPVITRKEAAKEAGVGEKKYDEGKVFLEAVESGEAPKEILEKVRSGEVSIHKAAMTIKESRKPTPAPDPEDEYTAAAPDEAPAAPVKPGKFPKLPKVL